MGDRAEAYSYRLELETTTDQTAVEWVALDDDSLGYDIRNTATSPGRHIEVKGSQGRDVRFFMSANEWAVGHRLGGAYEVHFWGGIVLTRSRPEEYQSLRAEGYPMVFRDLPDCVRARRLEAQASQYVVTRGSSSP